MNLRSEVLALVFGVLLILLTFGDNHLASTVGNLDSIFGHALWRPLDVGYPLASIAVFLLYGKVNGGLRVNALSIGMFFSYLVALALISLDDIAIVLKVSITLPKGYWVAVEWFYPIYSSIAFFVFGRANRDEKAKH
jgi:hypothetical protein